MSRPLLLSLGQSLVTCLEVSCCCQGCRQGGLLLMLVRSFKLAKVQIFPETMSSCKDLHHDTDLVTPVPTSTGRVYSHPRIHYGMVLRAYDVDPMYA